MKSTVTARRGRALVSASQAGTFGWGSGVHAMALLFVRSALALHAGRDLREAALSGEAESPAASFDYTLAKQTGWLSEIFGSDAQGMTLARRLIIRENPERKRPGPVIVSLRPAQFPPGSIEVFHNGCLVQSEAELSQLAASLENTWKGRSTGRAKPRKKIEYNRVDWAVHQTPVSRITDRIKTEIRSMLSVTDIFSKASCKKMLLAAQNSKFLTEWSKGARPGLNGFDVETFGRLGLNDCEATVRAELTPKEPIQCALPVAEVSSLALLVYLKVIKKYNVEINFRYSGTQEIGQRMLTEDFSKFPDICLLSLPSSLYYLARRKKNTFNPFFLCPQVSHRALAPGHLGNSVDKRGDYFLTNELPGGCSMYFHHLVESGEIRSASTQHSEPDETLKALVSGDKNVRGILWFPYYYLATEFGGCKVLDAPSNSENLVGGIFFAHESFMRNSRRATCFNIALRDAWLSLLENEASLNTVVEYILKQELFFNIVVRQSGLRHVQNGPARSIAFGFSSQTVEPTQQDSS